MNRVRSKWGRNLWLVNLRESQSPHPKIANGAISRMGHPVYFSLDGAAIFSVKADAAVFARFS